MPEKKVEAGVDLSGLVEGLEVGDFLCTATEGQTNFKLF